MSTRCPAQVKSTTATPRRVAAGEPRLSGVSPPLAPRTGLVTGGPGQDGFYLVGKLPADGWTVHAAGRDPDAAARLFGQRERLHTVHGDLHAPGPLCELVAEL